MGTQGSNDQVRLRRGIYNNDYFSGAQVAIYIGDVWIDEVTSLSFAVHQSRTPLYGYASTYFDAMSKGNILVQGEFSINFKEAGYLWLVLNRYRELSVDGQNKLKPIVKENNLPEWARTETIENIVSDRPYYQKAIKNDDLSALTQAWALSQQASLAGFSSGIRAGGGIGVAESTFEHFENVVWGSTSAGTTRVNGIPVDYSTRRADDSDLNPFDIYIIFGDYSGDDRIHHTIQKLQNVYIVGSSKQIVIDGQPIQESYQFMAQDLV